MEALAVAASIIAVIQITDRIAAVCKFYLGTIEEAPADLRLILLEVTALKALFESLKFLSSCYNNGSKALPNLISPDGPVEGCKKAVTELEALFPPISTQSQTKAGKSRKLQATLAALAWPLRETKARKLLEEIGRYKSTINLALTSESSQDIKAIRDDTLELRRVFSESERYEICKWLQHTDPSPLHNLACDLYESGTGDWMLRIPEWEDWIERKRRCLWVNGIPGAGKTILMSRLIKHIEMHCISMKNAKVANVYYYCYFGHNQDEAAPFLRWLLSQLCRHHNLVTAEIHQMFKKGFEPSLVTLLEAVESVLRHVDVVYVTIDALDESQYRTNILKVVRDLATDARFDKIQLLVASRIYLDIEKVLEPVAISVPMSNPYIEDDIRRLVNSTLHTDDRFARWPQELLHEVEDAVSKGAQGMFRWAVCQLDVIKKLKCERNLVTRALQNLPKTLDETYRRILQAVPEDERLFVIHALHWLSVHNDLQRGDNSVTSMPGPAWVQLSARSVALQDQEHSGTYLDVETLAQLCSCLVRVYQYPDHHSCVYFAHFTVREYMESPRFLINALGLSVSTELPCHVSAEVLLTEVLLPSEDEYDFSNGKDILSKHCAFLSFCLFLHWETWGNGVLRRDHLFPLLVELFNPFSKHYPLFIKHLIWNMDIAFHSWLSNVDWSMTDWTGRGLDPRLGHVRNILHVATYYSAAFALAKRYWEKESLTIPKESFSVFAAGRETILNRWYRSSAIIFSNSSGDIAIQFLSKYASGGQAFTRLLMLGAVFHCNLHGFSYYNEGDYYVKRSLEAGADINGKNFRVTPLQVATIFCRPKTVTLLLQAGANPNSIGGGSTCEDPWDDTAPFTELNHVYGVSPLFLCKHFGFNPQVCSASDKSHHEKDRIEIERLLLQHGAKEVVSVPDPAALFLKLEEGLRRQ